jgi:hypothetical protein
MARALPAGRTRRNRPLFGLVDGDGWAWASIKATFWLIVIIVTLGYIPDRAYYFVVSRTIDLEVGKLVWAPVNLCPPENTSAMPCPVPAGAILPWQSSPGEAALPAARAGGNAIQLGSNLLYAGGSDANGPTTTTFVTKVDKGSFGAWATGPALPEARTDAGLATISGVAYLVGGTGPDGTPTNTVWTLGLNPDTSELGTWTPVCTVELKANETCAADKVLTLPDARSGAAVVAVTDGILVAGGRGADNKPTATVWKSTLSDKGILGTFEDQPALPHAVTDAAISLEGTYVFVYGGTGDSGPVGGVMRAGYGAVTSATSSAGPTGAVATPAASGAAKQGIVQWGTLDAANLPVARTGGAGFSANGAMYYVGGSDGATTHGEMYWALPDASGNLPGGWHHLAATDLPGGLVEAAPIVAGSTVILIGGQADGGPLASSTRASLAPQEPFFRLGLFGVTVPGLQIGGEIGQQLGYLAAAGVGTGNFVILVIVAWAYNHRPQIASWWQRRKLAREARVPGEPEA